MRPIERRLQVLEQQANQQGERLFVLLASDKTPAQLGQELAALHPKPGERVILLDR